MDLNRKQFKTNFAGKELTLEVSKIANQTDATVFGTYGETTVMATVVMGKKDIDRDYFPLSVSFEEKYYAAGKILGGRFMKREARPSEDAILNGRLIDRTIRPLFNHKIRREMQVVVTVLSIDKENNSNFIGLLSASAAIAISQLPWGGPVAGVRIIKPKDGSLMVNPTNSELEKLDLELDTFVSGTKDKINMIELEGVEVKEDDIVKAFELGQKEITNLVSFQEKMIKEIGKEKADVPVSEPSKELLDKVINLSKDKLESTVFTTDKSTMKEGLGKLTDSIKEVLEKDGHDEKDLAFVDHILDDEVNDLVHEKALKEEKRVDGRKLDQVRDLYAEVGTLPRMHGSALFVRGETQSLSITTLGAPGDSQLVESMEFSGKKRFLLHYNFPPYSVGETGPFRGPGRREIGHGNLAYKAIKNLLPTQEEFPYTIRLVSEILSSNGSSSMATVCAGGLSLMDAGVPLKKPVAGIAMGLITDEKSGSFKVLTDIQGPEDHHGDMDFKVAGTDEGVTAMQMDVKVSGITLEMAKQGLEKAKQARLHILKTITEALAEPRKEVSKYAPVILNTIIDPEKIGEVIGPGGKMINSIIDETGATSIDIEDSGSVAITADSKEKAEKALNRVLQIVKEYQVGDIVEGNIVKILEFGAILDFGGKDGMIHVSELKDGFVKKVEDIVKLGDFVRAKIIKIEKGKIGLSIKQLK
ncbi:polyribonucleotide nucleotidyltransferase [Candidatus Wolfebacteria bacterium]|nr:polyribonucleotide nucleotidyltransferase [Candidatus Wolfebacteria bacterium]